MTAAFNYPEARSAIESAMSDYAAGRRLDARSLLAHLESLGPECGVHGYTMRMLPLIAALDAAEELEATCRLYLTLRGLPVRCLTPEQAAELLPPKGA